MQITTPMSDALGRYLDLASDQMKLTAANMANVDTPGYRTQGFDFEQEIARQMQQPAMRMRLMCGCRRWMGWWRGRMETTFRWIAKGCSWRSRSCSFGWACSFEDEYSQVMSAIHAEASKR